MPSHYESCRFLNKREKQLKFRHKLEDMGKVQELKQLEILGIVSEKYEYPLHAEL